MDTNLYESERVADAINEASFAAANEVYEYACHFPDRATYEPLEELAQRVQRRAQRAFCEVINRDRREGVAVLAAHGRDREGER